MRHIVDNAIPTKNTVALLQIAAVAMTAVAVKLVSKYYIGVTSANIQNLFITDIRDQLMAHALNIANPSQLRNAAGSLHDRIVSDVYRFINGAEKILIKPLIGSTTMLIYASYLVSIDVFLVPTVLTLVPALIATPWVNRRLSDKRRSIVTGQEHYAADLQETIDAVEDIQNHGTINIERSRLGRVSLAGAFGACPGPHQ
jgi:ABC-type multidrug transport system fused ATPase/permease subunit